MYSNQTINTVLYIYRKKQENRLEIRDYLRAIFRKTKLKVEKLHFVDEDDYIVKIVQNPIKQIDE